MLGTASLFKIITLSICMGLDVHITGGTQQIIQELSKLPIRLCEWCPNKDQASFSI